ncbi:MAG: preprotein translocase subunit SecY [Limnothrix sp.]|jgi:preprotein translocase subunit SecY|uniref:Protein translocase subunit SecY n=1 Tax=Limnothrix redekei LRLZ20PSL1 TaxID=3112953 RepID=A0ABW7C6F9_9CYAN|nr:MULTISPECIES: preprotein translocase subunit SecY [unclassified Limnothrix]MEB3118951.1 preprotein translocase subunit SecY [Limnothrix sp.]RFP56541.1 MAG: preprotein translocase subunit SecY [Limnothrix sp. CACIAM 69d]MBD2162494.1 preprotein translocase subunit SecY [Limnothrix sp. FACHB-1083]MBD2193551.1 preprotein translocase subunit SecY [Limnothrix sp. FACHB-1088]MBD2552314.1 preprotein translocase subunit SecY [Limnothrix sp. FACHB-708]
MVVSRDKAPTAQETFMQMAQAAGLRGRLLVTVGLLVLVRLGIFLPVPGIDRAAFGNAIQNSGLGGLVGFLDIFSGGGLSLLGIFALGILPYINASIIIQLLTAALPSLEDLQKNEGEAGRRKIAQITRYVSVAWAVIQSVGIGLWVSALGATTEPAGLFVVKTALALTAGSMFVMWIGELITERGVGNGASLLIFVNIVSTFPKSVGQTLELAQSGDRSTIGGIVLLMLAFMATIVGIVFVQEGARRIPIVMARRQVGRRQYQERSSYLPLRLNQGGVMPIIFSTAVLVVPASLAQFTNNEALARVATYLSPTGPTPWLYVLVYLALILFFSYFYSSLVVNPVDMAQNLKKMGASIPGVRPGQATSKRVQQILNRLTFLGAIFLGLVAIVPTAVESATNVRTFQGLGATSFLILVGVAIETAKQIQTYVISQRYEGMVKQ